MQIIGITGRSGCGKSTLTDSIRAAGFRCVDADQVAREVLLPGSPCIVQLQQEFGADIVDEAGQVRRRLLADRAFATPQGTAWLTAITQPEIYHRLDLAMAEARQAGEKLFFVDGAVIVGTPFQKRCSHLVLVAAPYETSVQRICARDGIAPEMARRRLDAQLPENVLRAAADFVIENDGTLQQMVILRVCMVLLALLLAAITLLNRGSDTVMNTAYPRKYDEYVTYYAGKYQIDPYILYSIIRTESNFNPQAESNVGARGLMQITEITFDWIKTKIAPDEPLTFDDLYDPEVNIRFGSYFISYCLQRYDDDLATAAAAYHSGLGTVDTLLADSQYSQDGKVLDAFPYPQMRRYVQKVTDAYAQYSEIYGTADSSG